MHHFSLSCSSYKISIQCPLHILLDEKCKSNLSSQTIFFNFGKNLQKHYFWYTLDQHLWSEVGLRMCFWLMMVRLCWVEWVVGLDHHVHQAAKWQSQGHRQFKLHAHFLFPPLPPSNEYGYGYKACNNYSVAMA